MVLNGIYTNRNIEKQHFWQVVYEWEDIFVDYGKIKLIDYNHFSYKLSRMVYNKYTKKFVVKPFTQEIGSEMKLSFLIDIYDSRNFRGKSNVIPIIIDFWGRHLDDFYKIFSKARLVYVTSYEVFRALTENSKSKNLEVRYIPLGISDKWKREGSFAKDIDIIQVGRKNSVLHKYALQYISTHKNVEYVYQQKIDNQPHYFSTKSGDLGVFHSREEYMNLFRRSKISLVSSPGMDGSKNTNGFNPVTPRFYESAINYCYMIGRYPENDDFRHCNVSSVCKNNTQYDDFEKIVDEYLSRDFDSFLEFDKFLEPHLTSKIFDTLQNELAGGTK